MVAVGGGCFGVYALYLAYNIASDQGKESLNVRILAGVLIVIAGLVVFLNNGTVGAFLFASGVIGIVLSMLTNAGGKVQETMIAALTESFDDIKERVPIYPRLKCGFISSSIITVTSR